MVKGNKITVKLYEEETWMFISPLTALIPWKWYKKWLDDINHL